MLFDIIVVLLCSVIAIESTVATIIVKYNENVTEKVMDPKQEREMKKTQHVHHWWRTDQDSIYLRCGKCTCGAELPSWRIVGGFKVKENEYPWMASLWNVYDIFFCGGSIISDQYVLTAAHCFSEDPIEYYKEVHVMIGQIKKPDKLLRNSPNVIQAALVKMHHKFDPKSENAHNNDIALVKLIKPIQFKSAVQPICLPIIRYNYNGNYAIIAGWGQNSNVEKTSKDLRHATLPMWSNYICSKIPEYSNSLITSNMLCAGFLDGGIDSCQGDSGGPLMVNMDNSKFTIAGIVSFGIGCGMPRVPGVYTRVDQYLKWITIHTQDSCHCSY